jgi:hypothetical protein
MNRRQRRAAAATSPTRAELSSASAIPMARPTSPNSSRPKAKTLYDIAAERQADLAPHGTPFPIDGEETKATASVVEGNKLLTLTSDGAISDTTPAAAAAAAGTSPAEGDLPLSPLLDTLLLSTPLSSLHFTLSFLTAHQYAQQDHLSIPTLLQQTLLVALPTLTLLIHLAHGHALPFATTTFTPRTRVAVQVAQQCMFVLAANIAGCYLIYLTNDRGYYAVMKRAPAIGTLWVWCIIELGLVGALAGVVGPGLFAWWNGYGVL